MTGLPGDAAAVPPPSAAGLDGVLLQALQAVQQAVCVADVTAPGEPLVWVNAAFTTETGYLPHEALGRNCRFLQDGLEAEGHDTSGPAAVLRDLLTRRLGGTVVIPNRRRDGTVFANELSLSPLTAPDGSVRHYVAVQRDVTDRVQAQAARDAAHAEADALADALQRQLVPRRLPDVDGLQVAVRYQPATREDGSRGEVSGDFYDLRALAGGDAVAVIGDVSGRGPRAAAVTAALRWAVRGLAGATSSPAGLLSLVAEAVHDALDDRFATVAVVHVPAPVTARAGGPPADHATDPAGTGHPVTVALAGHPQLVLLPPEGPPRLVGRPGLLLGPFAVVHLHDVVVDLAPGGCLVLYTDGVTEAFDRDRRLLGEDGLLQALGALGDRSPEVVADAVLDLVSRHVGDGPTDDLTLMVLRRNP